MSFATANPGAPAVPALPEMAMPGTASTVVFVAIVATLSALFVVAIRRAYGTGRATALAAAGVGTVLAVSFAAAHSGALFRLAGSPALMGYLALWNGLALGVALSPVGRRLATATPIVALVGFQAFRLPLELCLHAWYESGTIPIQMTYSGHNFDIATGILALIVGVILARGPVRVGIVWAFNVVGLALLVAVVRIAVLSSPVPFRSYDNEPVLLLVFHAPYTWILPICVAGALFGHVLVFRWLAAQRKTMPSS